VEETSESGSVPNLAVTNKSQRPLLIPKGRFSSGPSRIGSSTSRSWWRRGEVRAAGQLREAGRWRYKSRHFESKFCAPPSLRNKKMRAVNRNRSAGGAAASDQGEVWDEVQACLGGVAARSETASLTDAFAAAEETLKEHCKRLVLPEGAAGVLVGRDNRIIGMDLFDSRRRSRRSGIDCRTPISSMPYVLQVLPQRPRSIMPNVSSTGWAVRQSHGSCLGLGRRIGDHRRRACRGGSALRWRALPLGGIQRRGSAMNNMLHDRPVSSSSGTMDYARILSRCCFKEIEVVMADQLPLVRQWVLLRTLSSRHYGVTIRIWSKNWA